MTSAENEMLDETQVEQPPIKGYADPQYLQDSGAALSQLKQRSFALMQIQTGHSVLDVGCGPGIDTVTLAKLVGPRGAVVGVDHDAAMLSQAELRAAEAGVSDRVQHLNVDATALPFDADSFDSCHSERVFQHQPDPTPLLAEMVRVTRPGGWIVVVDIDYGTMSIDTPDVDLERRISRAHAELTLHNGYAGRQLYRLFRQQQLVDVAVELFPIPVTNYELARYLVRLDASEQEALTAGLITEVELERWQSSLHQAAAENIFFGSVSMIIASGRKPAVDEEQDV
ncbi:MAG TPA: methyltransferase domain-containing protein [Herpetosiphonaceae bacterium]